MDKGKIQTFSNTVREKLLQETKRRAAHFGITRDHIHAVDQEFEDSIIINGKILDKKIKNQRDKLVKLVKIKGYDNIIDEVTYTWFNRFVALKYMEVNEYIPIKVFSSRDIGKTEPDLITDATSLTFLDLDKEFILTMKDQDKTEELYQYLIIKLCNWLHEIMPFLFEQIEDYTELLFLEKLLHTDFIIRDLNDIIPIEDWKEVEIIGWIYQDYIAPRKENVFADLKKNIKISKENIPAATQLFTPKWIVKYMVENSLGRLWLESNSNPDLQSNWKYYIDQEYEPPEEKTINPETITILDPAMGSGHILVYAFDILYEIYREKGYLESDIAPLILKMNLYGLEIDDRATQLAGFALMMKARSYDKDLFNKVKETKLNLVTIEETNGEPPITKDEYPELHRLWYQYIGAKNFGSILILESFDHDKLASELQRLVRSGKVEVYEVIPILEQLIFHLSIMDSKYDCVITNPPYMGNKGMNSALKSYLKDNYLIAKNDLMTVFMDCSFRMTKNNGYLSMINLPSWMFLSSFEKFRNELLCNYYIRSLVHNGRGIFGSDFGSVTFTIQKNKPITGKKGIYRRLFNEHVQVRSVETIKNIYLTQNIGRFSYDQNNFKKIPGSLIAYWVSESLLNAFTNGQSLGTISEPRTGLQTGENEKFVRTWAEISISKCCVLPDAEKSGFKWFPYNKGGEFRKWYGNADYVINWNEDGKDIKEDKLDKLKKGLCLPSNSKPKNQQYYFRECGSWTKISSSRISVRYFPSTFIFDIAGCAVFSSSRKQLEIIIGFLNSPVSMAILKIVSPTLNYQPGDVAVMPLLSTIFDHNTKIYSNLIRIAKDDWASYEKSWDFTIMPLLHPDFHQPTLKAAYNLLRAHWNHLTQEMQQLEEENNRIFIEEYGLQDELMPIVSLNEITLTSNPHYRYASDKNEVELEKLMLKDTIKEFISYTVGCMFGRYSLDKPGLVLANQGETLQDYLRLVPEPSFIPYEDNIIPILDEEYFTDDIVGRFREFLKVTFGNETLSENLDFIADALGRTGQKSSEEVIRNYFLKDFFKDHCKMYKKRPIYWLFSSDKDKAFNALIYMHRYNKDTVGKIRVDYLHKLQGMIEGQLVTMQNLPNDPRERKKAEKKVAKLKKQMEEIRKYEEELKHIAENPIEIDLDDGVKVNYAKFGDLLQKI